MSKAMYPLLFAVFPVLFLFAHNISEVPEMDLVLPLAVAAIGAVGVLFMLKLVTKSYAKAGVATLLFLVLFYSYGWAMDAFFPGLRGILKFNLVMLSVWVAVFIAGVVVLCKINKGLVATTRFLNIVAIVLVLISLGGIGIGVIGGRGSSGGGDEYPVDVATGNLPSIYYIILDTYARQDILNDKMGYDNSCLIDYLKSKGFYIADKSCSNYCETGVSIASALNMDYADEDRLDDDAFIYGSIVDSKVSQFLRERGYRYIFVDGGMNIKGIDREASVRSCTKAFGIELGGFSYELCKMTALAPFGSLFSSFGGDLASPIRYGANNVLYALDVLPTISLEGSDRPVFVYAHIMCPHPPGFFDKNGIKKFVLFGEDTDFYPAGYLDNMNFINPRIMEMVDAILANSGTPLIIVLQGDHGTAPADDGGYHYCREILNAYYLPSNGSGGENMPELYDEISPVNSFRVIFNYYFGTEYELLEDRLAGASNDDESGG